METEHGEVKKRSPEEPVPPPDANGAAAPPPPPAEEPEEEETDAPEPSPDPAPSPADPGHILQPGASAPDMPRPTLTTAQLFAEAQKKANAAILASGTKPSVDKYFGSKLPPVCRQLGCYVTDDGRFFYCINPHCHKDKKRETKYNRRKKSVVYFFCPKCKSREIQLHLKSNAYECLDCAYNWKH